jgi:hypothetical protein
MIVLPAVQAVEVRSAVDGENYRAIANPHPWARTYQPGERPTTTPNGGPHNIVSTKAKFKELKWQDCFPSL